MNNLFIDETVLFFLILCNLSYSIFKMIDTIDCIFRKMQIPLVYTIPLIHIAAFFAPLRYNNTPFYITPYLTKLFLSLWHSKKYSSWKSALIKVQSFWCVDIFFLVFSSVCVLHLGGGKALVIRGENLYIASTQGLKRLWLGNLVQYVAFKLSVAKITLS